MLTTNVDIVHKLTSSPTVAKKEPMKAPRGKKIALLDLNNSDADNDDREDEAIAEKERKALEQLESHW
jgi:hypothetical protein